MNMKSLVTKDFLTDLYKQNSKIFLNCCLVINDHINRNVILAPKGVVTAIKQKFDLFTQLEKWNDVIF